MANLQEAASELLLLCALAPQPISLDLLVAVSGKGPVEALREISGYLSAGTLVRDQTLGEGYYQFGDSKAPVRIVTEAPSQRVSEIANTLIEHLLLGQREGVERHVAISRVCSLAGLTPQRADWVVEAAIHSQKEGLTGPAVSFYQLALSNLSKRELADQRDWRAYVDCALGLVKLRGHLMPLAEQRDLLSRALDYAERLNSPVLSARLKLVYAQLAKVEGEYTEAAQTFDEAWQLAEQAANEELLHQAALATAEFLFWQGRVRDAVERYETVVGSLEVLSTEEGTLKGCAVLGWCYSICGHTARGIGLIRAVREKGAALSLKDVTVYADLMMTLALLEARRTSDAEPFVANVLAQPEEALGHYTLWAAEACMAYIHYTRGDLAATYRHQCAAYEHSRLFGWAHHRGPYNFEYLDGLEDAGIVHPEMNYESELKRVLQWPDIFMQGVGWRCKAMRARKKNSATASEILTWLEKSMELLQRAGAMLELARTQMYLAQVLLSDRQEQRAVPLIKKAWAILCTEHEELFPHELRRHLPEKDREEQLIRTFLEIGDTLGTLRDREQLLKKVIDLTVRLTGAERGGFFILGEGGDFHVAASRNLELGEASSLDQGLREVLARASQTERDVVLVAGYDQTDRSHARGWKIGSPVSTGGQMFGVFYLESNLIAAESPDSRLPLLCLIGNQLAIALDNARAYERIAELKNRLEEETRLYRSEKDVSLDLQELVGKSDSILSVLSQVRKVAATSSDVLLLGETGVGKELVARAIHRLSDHRTGAFIPVSVSSLAPELVASELFGHERGAFTGASHRRLGRFELADGGTIFLDEVDTLSAEMQIRLLRVLQEREFERVGGSQPVRSDFRVIAASNQDLEERVRLRQFRADLYYRLKVFPIRIPPLRERKEDIPHLVNHFLEIFNARTGKQVDGVTERTMLQLMDYSWPGNVRELRHVIERSVILSEGKILRAPELHLSAGEVYEDNQFPSLEEMERRHIVDALKRCHWKVSGKGGAAVVLGLKASTLFSRMRKLGISKTVSYAAES